MFFALSDPVRRRILETLDGEPKLVSELAAPFEISLQAVSRHIQVLVRAGLVAQERTGRISRCSLVVGPIYEARCGSTATASTGRSSSTCWPPSSRDRDARSRSQTRAEAVAPETDVSPVTRECRSFEEV